MSGSVSVVTAAVMTTGLAGIGKGVALAGGDVNADGKLAISFAMVAISLVFIVGSVWKVARAKSKQEEIDSVLGRKIKGLRRRINRIERVREQDQTESQKFRHTTRQSLQAIMLRLGISDAVQRDRDERQETKL